MSRLLSLGFLTLAALAVRRYLATRAALAAVPKGFRNPLLPLLTRPIRPRTLPLARMCLRIPTRAGAGVSVAQQTIPADPSVPAVIFSPADSDSVGAARPVVLYLHGGGMVTGSPQFEATGAGRLVRELGAVVVSPDYRLAPEHPFPAPLDDCMATLHWMRRHSAELGIDAERIAVAGSSAGGGLAAAVAQRAHDEGIALRAQVLVYPMIDDRSALRDDFAGAGEFLWTPESNLFGWTAYLGHPPRLADAPPYASPARREDLSGLAPAWIGVGGLDLFHDEAVDYARRLTACGVVTELVDVPGMYHGADGLAGKHPAMQAFRRSSEYHLRRYL